MNSYYYLAKRLALTVGVAAIGAAAAWTVALVLLQDAGIAAGALPEPGTPISSAKVYQSNPLWQAAKTLQSLANYSGIVGAVFVLAYGISDRYGSKIREELSQ